VTPPTVPIPGQAAGSAKEGGSAGHRQLLPSGWPRPKGYSNGVIAHGPTIFVGGQIGWDVEGRFAPGLVEQVEQALRNVVAVLAEGGAAPRDVVRLTWYVVDVEAYAASQREIGRVYREVIGQVYPPMTLVQVVRLVEAKALVEIEATAVLAHQAAGTCST
jgi:enamine deaminase RidA (YjgF/YER057c/UK114 family)